MPSRKPPLTRPRRACDFLGMRALGHHSVACRLAAWLGLAAGLAFAPPAPAQSALGQTAAPAKAAGSPQRLAAAPHTTLPSAIPP